MLDVVYVEQMNLPGLSELLPLFSPLTAHSMNVAGSLTLVADPMVWNGRTIQQSKNEFVNTHGNTENVAYSTLQAVTTKCGNEVILKSLEENRKTALTNVLRQINEMESLLSSVNNEEIVRVNVLQLNRLFMNMQSAH